MDPDNYASYKDCLDIPTQKYRMPKTDQAHQRPDSPQFNAESIVFSQKDNYYTDDTSKGYSNWHKRFCLRDDVETDDGEKYTSDLYQADHIMQLNEAKFITHCSQSYVAPEYEYKCPDPVAASYCPCEEASSSCYEARTEEPEEKAHRKRSKTVDADVVKTIEFAGEGFFNKAIHLIKHL